MLLKLQRKTNPNRLVIGATMGNDYFINYLFLN